jgi:hypothetical protein
MRLRVLVVAALFACGKESAASDLSLAMSASPPGVRAVPGFTVSIPNPPHRDVVVVRIDDKKIPMLVKIDLARQDDAVAVELVETPGSLPMHAVSGVVSYAESVDDRVSVWMDDVLFRAADGREVRIPHRGGYYVPLESQRRSKVTGQ